MWSKAMRSWTTLLLAVLLMPIPALAQADSAAAAILQDGGGDVKAEANGTPAGAIPGGRYAATDLLGLTVQESITDFTMTLAVASLSNPGETLAESARYTIRFAHGPVTYEVWMFRSVIQEPTYFAYLGSVDPGTGYTSWLEDLPVTVDAAAGTMAVSVPRDLLVDEDGSAPFPGRVLAGFRTTSIGFFDTSGASIGLGPGGEVPFPGARLYDAMPEPSASGVDWAVQLGLAQTGDARLVSPVPVRSSNGEATTFVFTVTAMNLGPQQRFRLAATGTPATWQVSLPSDLVEVAEKSSVDLPILVSVPFAHEHGRLQQFTLEMTGVDDPGDVGRIRLGVRYTTPPQPAGHHDTVFLHTAKAGGDPTLDVAFSTAFGFDPTQMYFNTLAPADDENDAGTPVGGAMRSFNPPTVKYSWWIPLSPSLQMGLDFDLARQGVLRVPIDTVLPMPGAVLSGRLVHTYTSGEEVDCSEGCTIDDIYFGAGEHTKAATIGPSAAQDVAPNSKATPFEAAIVPTPGGDYLPFQPGATLVLELNLTFTRVDPLFGPRDAPKLAGGEMVLPLLEYHDPVDQVFSSLSSLMIEVQGEQQRMVNPGRTALFELRLMNHGDTDASYDLELDGANLGWASILGERRVSIPAGEERTLGVAVTAPGGAPDGAVSDLVLAAVDTRDPTARTLARLLTTVDTEAEHPDDSSRVPGLSEQLSAKDSPSPGLAAVALAVVALALALRRRR